MYDHAKPTIREINPEHIILHVGTNDLNLEKAASQIANSVIELANSLKNKTNSVKNKTTSSILSKQKIDKAGKILILDVTLDADQYILINLYNANTETE